MSKNKPLLLVERAAIAEDLWVVKTNSLIGYDHVCQTEGEAKGIAVLIANCLTKDRELIQTLVNALADADIIPEINPSNYNHDDVMDLNDHGISASVSANTALALAGEQGYKPTDPNLRPQ